MKKFELKNDQSPYTTGSISAPTDSGKKTNIEKAVLLSRDYNISKKELFAAHLAYPGSFYRAELANKLGYNIGETGRHQDLCDKDEEILLHWITELLDQNEVVYSWKLISLVCDCHTHRRLTII